VVVVLLAATAAAAGIAWHQRTVAATWRDRSVGLEAERDEALTEVVVRRRVFEEQLTALTGAIETSEADVADLEERLRALADEKAQAEDAVVTGEVEREALRDVSARIGGAVAALDACVSQLFDLQGDSVAAFNRAAAGDEVDVEPLNDQAARTTEFCNEARAAAANAGAAADQLLGP
jgi:chromosome segregation ATPase